MVEVGKAGFKKRELTKSSNVGTKKADRKIGGVKCKSKSTSDGSEKKKTRPRGGKRHNIYKKRKKEKETAKGLASESESGDAMMVTDASDSEQDQQPSESRLLKVQQLKNKAKQLSNAEFQASRQRAATIAQQSADVQADWLWSSYQSQTAASSLERDGLTAECLVPIPLQHQSSLEDALKVIERNWQQEFCSTAHRQPGQLSLLIVSPAAIGCVNIIKLLPKRTFGSVLKLFAKHFKVHEQAKMLEEEKASLGAGTPNRLLKLIEQGALTLDLLKWIIVDVSLDVKQRTMMDQPDVKGDWWELFNRHLQGRVASGEAKIVLYSQTP